ncbi:MAG: hypothetical protein M5U26_24495 [Planctomycetota bacterium]|nr:hypothetical protein [Planctomycetota bacterium]
MSTKALARKSAKPVVLKNWDEVAAYLAKKLKPVGQGPKGQPIYDDDEVKALNIQMAKPS